MRIKSLFLSAFLLAIFAPASWAQHTGPAGGGVGRQTSKIEISPYGGYLWSGSAEWKFSIIFGVGAKIYVTDRIGLRIQGLLPWIITSGGSGRFVWWIGLLHGLWWFGNSPGGCVRGAHFLLSDIDGS